MSRVLRRSDDKGTAQIRSRKGARRRITNTRSGKVRVLETGQVRIEKDTTVIC